MSIIRRVEGDTPSTLHKHHDSLGQAGSGTIATRSFRRAALHFLKAFVRTLCRDIADCSSIKQYGTCSGPFGSSTAGGHGRWWSSSNLSAVLIECHRFPLISPTVDRCDRHSDVKRESARISDKVTSNLVCRMLWPAPLKRKGSSKAKMDLKQGRELKSRSKW